MNVTPTAGIVLLAVVLLGIIEVYRLRSHKRRREAALALTRRLPQLERRMTDAFSGPRAVYGDLFAEFSIWRHAETTRMDVATRDPWLTLNAFTQSLILRHLWRSLANFARSSVLVQVDPGTPRALVWSATSTENFNDGGNLEPWAPAKGRVGTLLPGP